MFAEKKRGGDEASDRHHPDLAPPSDPPSQIRDVTSPNCVSNKTEDTGKVTDSASAGSYLRCLSQFRRDCAPPPQVPTRKRVSSQTRNAPVLKQKKLSFTISRNLHNRSNPCPENEATTDEQLLVNDSANVSVSDLDHSNPTLCDVTNGNCVELAETPPIIDKEDLNVVSNPTSGDDIVVYDTLDANDSNATSSVHSIEFSVGNIKRRLRACSGRIYCIR